MTDTRPTSGVTFTTDLDGDFSSLTFSDISPTRKSEKTPKKILHFSDGTLEEYSSDEEKDEETIDSGPPIDPKSLSWGQWMQHRAAQTGKSMLSTCDYVGEGIANFLGITSQKYFYEIEEYKRSLEEEEVAKREEAAQMAGWNTGDTAEVNPSDPSRTPNEYMRKNFEIAELRPLEEKSEEKEKF